jgi:hypothetical protein
MSFYIIDLLQILKPKFYNYKVSAGSSEAYNSLRYDEVVHDLDCEISTDDVLFSRFLSGSSNDSYRDRRLANPVDGQ